MAEDIITLILLISLFDLFFLVGFDVQDFSIFNPIRNYREWTNMNWFGVILATVLLNVGFPLYAFCYWFYKLCTVGRSK